MKYRRLELFLFVFLFLTGCAGVRTGPPVASDLTGTSWMLQRPSGTVQDLSLEQITNTLSTNNSKFTTLKAKAKITVDTPDIEGPMSFNGYVRLQRPEKMRIIGTKLISTVFDMLTDGETFWLHLPSEKKVYTGKNSSQRRLAKLGVNQFLDDIAMLLDYSDVLTPGAILTKGVNRTTIMETWPGLWLIHIIDFKDGAPKLRANLYIDRVGVNVIRYDIFSASGNISVQAFFDDYRRADNVPLPQSVAIFWPDKDATLTLFLTDTVVNEQINPKVFQFSKPKAAEMVFLDDVM